MDGYNTLNQMAGPGLAELRRRRALQKMLQTAGVAGPGVDTLSAAPPELEDVAIRQQAANSGVVIPPPQVIERNDDTLPAVRDHGSDRPRGFWGNVGHHVEHGLKGLMMGLATGNPLAGVVGLGAGLIKPKLADNMEYNFVTKPAWQQQQAINESLAEKRARRQAQQAQIENLGADNRRADEAAKQQTEQFGINKELQREQITDLAQSRKERAAAAAVDRAREYGEIVPLEAVKGTSLEYLGGKRAPVKPVNTPAPHFENTDRGLMVWNPQTQRLEPAPTADNQPVRRYEKPDNTEYQRDKDQREDTQGREREASSIKQKFEAAKSKATTAAAKATAMQQAKPDETGQRVYKGKYITDEDVAAAWAERDAAAAEMSGSVDELKSRFGDIVEVSPDGTAVRIKSGGQARQGTSASPRASSQRGGPKTILSSEQVKAYADANGWTPDQARTYLLNTGKYKIQ